nr:TPA_asm: tailspike [Megastigmus wasp adintovirus]
MSVDLFGRYLSHSEGNRGPIGYKLTTDGQYSLENRRLCNVAEPVDSKDVVNLKTLQKTVKTEIESVKTITSQLKDKINDVDEIVDIHRDEIDEKLRKLEVDIQVIRDLLVKRSSL